MKLITFTVSLISHCEDLFIQVFDTSRCGFFRINAVTFDFFNFIFHFCFVNVRSADFIILYLKHKTKTMTMTSNLN